VLGIVGGYVDVATRFKFDFLTTHFGLFLAALALGVVIWSIGLVGWARRISRGSRVQMAGLVFVSPWIAGLLGYPIAGDNVHGPAVFVMVLIIPASLLAVVLLIMAALTSSTKL
jgi:hypothetical protein